MAKKYNLYQIDAFTKEKFTGNPAGVITNADGLTEDQMQKIASELNNSETAFIFESNSADYDMYIRYFTPKNEVPICGHATIAAHYALAKEKNLGTKKVLQKSGAGILPVEIIKINDSHKIVMTQAEIKFCEIIENDKRNEMLKALGLKESDIIENLPIQIVSTGYSKVIIPIKNIDTLNSLEPDLNSLCSLSHKIGSNGYYVFAFNHKNDDILIEARMFAPVSGVNEDPVTGNAAGPLGAYLVRYKLAEHDGKIFSFNTMQGKAMGRPGVIGVEVQIKDNEPLLVKIFGEAVIAYKTKMLL